MIIVDGPDHTGKTTLVKYITDQLNRRGYPHVFQHLSKLPESFDTVMGYKNLINRDVVFDRFHMSREVYGSVVGGQTLNTEFEIDLIDAWVKQEGGITIHVTADEYWLAENFGDKDEMYDLEIVEEANFQFKQLPSDYYYETGVHSEFTFPSENIEWVETILDQYVSNRERLTVLGL